MKPETDDEWRSRIAAKQDIEWRDRTNRKILSEYARLGLDPIYAGNMLVSPSLAAILGGLKSGNF